MTTSADLQRRLFDTAQELVVEFGSLSAGTVLRCFFRAAHQARLSGIDPSSLPQVARQLTRTTLTCRLSARSSAQRGAARIAVARRRYEGRSGVDSSGTSALQPPRRTSLTGAKALSITTPRRPT